MKDKENVILLIVFILLSLTKLDAQDTRNIFLNQCLNTPIDSDRMLLLDRIMLESGTIFPVFSRPITNNEWFKYVDFILKNKSENLSEYSRSRLGEFIPDIKFEGMWNTEIYGRAQIEGIGNTNDRKFYLTRYEERLPLWKLNLEASRDTMIGFAISTIGRNTWTVYDFTENKTNLPVDVWQDIDFRIFHKAYFSYQSPQAKITVQVGRDDLRWGVGKKASLFLSDEVPFFDFVKFVLWFDQLKFSMLYSTLTDYEPQFTNKGSYYDASGLDKAPKSMLLQRIEYDLLNRVNFGLSYMKIIYGRDPVLGDINPFIFQHNLFKEYQNSVASFDITASILPGVQLYGEVTSDEINFSNDFKLDNAADPTAVSYQFGVNLYYKNYYLNSEYVFIAPFMYNHYHFLGRAIEIDGLRDFRSKSRSLRYMALGHWLSPDSRNLSLTVERTFSKYLTVNLTGETRRSGEINLLTPFPDKNYIASATPSGIAETISILGGSINYSSNRYIFRGGVKYITIENFNNVQDDNFNSLEFQLSCGVKFEIL